MILFEGNKFSGDVAPALAELNDNGTVRIIDFAFVRKEAVRSGSGGVQRRRCRCAYTAGTCRRSRQNSLPSGSASTCQLSLPVWPMSARRAPAASSR